MQDVISGAQIEMNDEFYKHLEEFAAAFYKYTSLPPDHIVMIVEHKYTLEGLVQRIWFEEKSDLPTPRS